MDHRAFFDDVAKGKIAPCYVFEGTEEYIKRSALAALRKKLRAALDYDPIRNRIGEGYLMGGDEA